MVSADAGPVPTLYARLDTLLRGFETHLAATRAVPTGLLPATVFPPLQAQVASYTPPQGEDETLLKEATSQYVSRWVLDEFPSIIKLCDRCDALLALEEAGLVDPVAALVTLEAAFDMLVTAEFGGLLDYIDARRERLFEGLVPGKGKGLVVLRLANEIRRRLSKPVMAHTLLAGRIATLLSVAFPLGDRSASNLKGDFNLKNTTDWDTVDICPPPKGSKRPREKDIPLEESVVPSNRIYALFWATQEFFRKPAVLFEEENVVPADLFDLSLPDPLEGNAPPTQGPGSKGAMHEFARSLVEILRFFQRVNTYEDFLAGTAAKEEMEKQTLLPGQESSPTSMDTDLHKAQEEEQDIFYPKYLTGRNYFPSEIRDPSFRRQVLVQVLILLQYLLEFSPARRQVWSESSNKMSHRPYVLSEKEEAFCRIQWKAVLDLLDKLVTPTRRSGVVPAILRTIRLENAWTTWKNDRAPSLDIPPMSSEEQKTFEPPLKRLRTARPGKYHFELGTAALQALWQDGVPPPRAGTTRRENEEGEYVTVPTDGLEELEFPPLNGTDLDTYISPWLELEGRIDDRRKDLGGTTGREAREQLWRRKAQVRALQTHRTLVISLKSQLHRLEARANKLREEVSTSAKENELRPEPKEAASDRNVPGEQHTVEAEEQQKGQGTEECDKGNSDQSNRDAERDEVSQAELVTKAQTGQTELSDVESQISSLKEQIPASTAMAQASTTAARAQDQIKRVEQQNVREGSDKTIHGLEERQSSLAWRGLRLAALEPSGLKTLSLAPFDDLSLIRDAFRGDVTYPQGRIDGGREMTPEPEKDPETTPVSDTKEEDKSKEEGKTPKAENECSEEATESEPRDQETRLPELSRAPSVEQTDTEAEGGNALGASQDAPQLGTASPLPPPRTPQRPAPASPATTDSPLTSPPPLRDEEDKEDSMTGSGEV